MLNSKLARALAGIFILLACRMTMNGEAAPTKWNDDSDIDGVPPEYVPPPTMNYKHSVGQEMKYCTQICRECFTAEETNKLVNFFVYLVYLNKLKIEK